MPNENIDQARQMIYNLLALCLVEEHAKANQKQIIQDFTSLSQHAFDEEVAKASLKIIESMQDKELLYKEYQNLFLVPFGKYVPLSASWYFEEREGGAMLVNMRSFLANTTIRRDEQAFCAPEDHYGFIFTFMSYLLKNALNDKGLQGMQRELFVSIINPYCDALSLKLMESESKIYTHVGTVLHHFCAFERAYLEVYKSNQG